MSRARAVIGRSMAPGSCVRRWASTAVAGTAADKEKKKAYSNTLRLPKTDLPLRLKDAPAHEAQFRDRTTHELYRKQVG